MPGPGSEVFFSASRLSNFYDEDGKKEGNSKRQQKGKKKPIENLFSNI